MKCKALIILMVGLICGFADAQTISKNLNLADFVSYQTLYSGQSITPADDETIADVASWKDTSTGKEYALVCLFQPGSASGVAVYDVTTPSNVASVKTIKHPDDNTPHDVKVYNDIAYIAQDNGGPTYWVELEDAIDNPGNATAGYGGDISSDRIHNLFINADHELLFLSYFAGDQNIQVYDISGVPGSAPDFVGGIPQYLTGIGSRSHDLYAQTLSGTTGRVYDATLTSITVSNYTWSSGSFSAGTQLAHEFNPRRGEGPDDFTNVITPETERVVHGTWIGQDSDYLFATVEGNSGHPDTSTWVGTSVTSS